MKSVRPLLVLAAAAALVAAAPPPAKGASMEIEWELLTAALQGGRNNGYARACDAAPGVKQLTFTVEAAGKKAVTSAPCTAGGNRGVVKISLPEGAGPYTVTAVADGLAKSKSERVKGFTAKDVVHLRIYAEGCDQAACE